MVAGFRTGFHFAFYQKLLPPRISRRTRVVPERCSRIDGRNGKMLMRAEFEVREFGADMESATVAIQAIVR